MPTMMPAMAPPEREETVERLPVERPVAVAVVERVTERELATL